MIGELFEHVEAIGRLALCQVRRNLGPFGGLAAPIMKGAFEREVAESGDLLAPRVLSADCYLSRDQRRGAHRLQRFKQLVDRTTRLLALVAQQDYRKAPETGRQTRRERMY